MSPTIIAWIITAPVFHNPSCVSLLLQEYFEWIRNKLLADTLQILHSSPVKSLLPVCLAFFLLPLFGLAQFKDFKPTTWEAPSTRTVNYRLLPPLAPVADTHPLILFLHGSGERGDNNAQGRHIRFLTEPATRKAYPCFVLAPQCPRGEQWVNMPWGPGIGEQPENPSAALADAMALLDHLLATHPIDPKRIYITGLSMGGFGTWDAITRYPNRFAAAAPICGGGDPDSITAATAKIPIWSFHAADDRVVSVKGTDLMSKAVKKRGGKPHVFLYPKGGHASWGPAFREPELLPWMFAQRLGKPDSFQLKTKAP